MKFIKIFVSALFVFAFSVQGSMKVVARSCDDLVPDSGTGHYLISTVKDLQTMACLVNTGSTDHQTGIYDLQNDIDLTGVTWVPIGTSSNPFKGTFNGNDHILDYLTITALTTTHTMYNGFVLYGTGLFGDVQGATISELTLQNANLNVRSNVWTDGESSLLDLSLIGVLAASAELSTVIHDVAIKDATVAVTNPSMMDEVGTTWPFTYVGGIVGRLSGLSSIADSWFTGTMNVQVEDEDNQSLYMGGLAGGIEQSGIESSWIDADLTFTSASEADLDELVVGGLTGYAFNSGITDSYVRDMILTVRSDTVAAAIGGIAGTADAVTIIEHAMFHGMVDSSTNNVGGLIGFVQEPDSLPEAITPQNGYFLILDTNNVTGIIKGHDGVGGLIGKAYYSLKAINNWFEGAITAHSNVGGLIGDVEECRAELMTSFSLGYLSASNNLGGIIGMGYSENILTDVFSRMDLFVVADPEITPQGLSLYDVGGIAGFDYGMYTIYTNVYFAGRLFNQGSLTLGQLDPIANFLNEPVTMTSIYFDHDLWPIASDVGTPKTTPELKAFTGYTGFTYEDPWFIDPAFNGGYAYFYSGYYRVVVDDGTTPYGFIVQPLAMIMRPSDPTRTGYVFGGWYTNPNFTTTWNFNTDQVTQDVTLYAKWTEAAPDTGEAANFGLGFLGLSLILWTISRKQKTQS